MTSKPDSPDQKPSFIEAVRRAQITECAIECIAEIGYVNASLAKIAKRADISTGVISYHFASKDDLIRAVIAHVMDTAVAYIQPRIDWSNPRAALRSGIEAVVAYYAAHRDYSLALLKINLAGGAGTPTEPYDPEIQERRQRVMREILAQGQEDGSFRPFDIGVMVAAIFGAFDTVPRKVAADPPVDLPAYGRELAELFDRATRAD
jgi:TetR/AcrR family transcriptional regulator, fatty acid metabolism regulator protein